MTSQGDTVDLGALHSHSKRVSEFDDGERAQHLFGSEEKIREEEKEGANRLLEAMFESDGEDDVNEEAAAARR